MNLEEIKAYICGWLDAKVQTGKFSQVLIDELALHCLHRTADVRCILDEIGYLENPASARLVTKSAKPLKGPLKEFWHQHWFEARFLSINLINFAKSKEAKPIFENMANAIDRGNSPEHNTFINSSLAAMNPVRAREPVNGSCSPNLTEETTI